MPIAQAIVAALVVACGRSRDWCVCATLAPTGRLFAQPDHAGGFAPQRRGSGDCQCSGSGIEDRVQAPVAAGLGRFPAQLATTYRQLLVAYRQVGDYDAMVLGYPGQIDNSWPAIDPLAPQGRWYWMFLCRSISSPRNAAWWRATRVTAPADPHTGRAGLPPAGPAHPRHGRICGLVWPDLRAGGRALSPGGPTGADRPDFPAVEPPPRDDCCFSALYYGTFIRNHGVWTRSCVLRRCSRARQMCASIWSAQDRAPTGRSVGP